MDRIPEVAIVLTKNEVLEQQKELIDKWRPTRDTMFLRYSGLFLSSTTLVYSSYIVANYRKALKLGHQGRIHMVLPCVVIPSVLSFLKYNYVTDNIILMKKSCSICLELQAIVFQTWAGLVYPMILATATGFYLSSTHYTYPLPSTMKESKELLKVWLKLTKPLMPKLRNIFVVQLVLTAFVTNMTIREYNSIAFTGKLKRF